MSKKDKSKIYNILAFTFESEEAAEEAVKEIKKSGLLEGQMIVAEAIVAVDEKGKTHIHEPGHGTLGGAVGAVGGGLLGLIGGPAGLLAWTVGGAVIGGVAGKYLGRPFSKGELEAIGEQMQPNTSAFMLLVEDIDSEIVLDKMEDISANVLTLTVGDELSGEIASYMAGEVHDSDGNMVAGESLVAADGEGNVVGESDVVAISAETDEFDAAAADESDEA